MILPTLPIGSSARATGFTLLELLLVVSMIALLAAVAVPRLRSTTNGAAITTSAREIGELLAFFRAKAVKDGLRIKGCFSGKDGQYWFVIQRREHVGGEEYEAFGDPFLDAIRQLPVGVVFREVNGRVPGELETIVAMPDGSCTGSGLSLSGLDRRRIDILLGTAVDDVRQVRVAQQ